ncbi:MAG TPA: hypothetical protein VGF57_09910 [Roseiarcus sp.]|jgi:hypothetical protein
MSGHYRIIVAATFGSVCLAGCSSTTGLVSGINAVAGALSSPTATQAAANLQAGAKAIVCDVSGVASLAQSIEKQGVGSKVMAKDTSDVYAASSAVCAALGGSAVPGTVTVPASATPVVAAAAATTPAAAK